MALLESFRKSKGKNKNNENNSIVSRKPNFMVIILNTVVTFSVLETTFKTMIRIILTAII